MRTKITIVALLLVIVILALGAFDNISYTLNLFTNSLRIVQERYVEGVDISELVKKAIEGMLFSLDPNSSYLDEDDYRELSVKTKGEFGGLGIQISIRNGWLTIIAPIEGTPAYRAGLRPGDIITKIEGVSTKGITTSDAVKKMRGTPGTKITITIAREGEEEADYTIERAVIKIKDVPYYGLISDDIGYIRLVNFSRGAGEEVEDAVKSLYNDGARKLILDLTGNPGGLLIEAVAVSDNFIERNNIIVSTRGRIPESNKEYKAVKDLAYGRYPLVVLVNGASASASEIVAGAIQDWSRGIIIGDTTFGKGSVQTVIPMGGMEALKLTTARYYTPSGRCIDHSDTLRFLLKNPTASMTFSSLRDPIRKLCAAGGISPDIFMREESLPPVVGGIWRKGGFIAFAAHYTRLHPDMERVFKIGEDTHNEFRRFLKDEKELEIKESEWDEAKVFIERYLKSAIAESMWDRKGKYEESYLVYSPLVKKAVEILKGANTTEEVFAQMNW